MRLGNWRKRGSQAGTRTNRQRRPALERLERREMFAVYLPDTFAHPDLQPVGSAFNGGEQAFFGGHGGGLQFEFGSSPVASSYNGTGWHRKDVDDLIAGSIDDIAGTPSLYVAPAVGGAEQLHAVYRTTTGKILDVWSSPWQSRELVASGAASDPTAATLNGGRQVLYVGTDGHVHFVASSDGGVTWNDTNLTDLVGLGSDPSAVAVATGGVVAMQVGSFEYYVYHRADGGLGYFLWSGTAWGYDALDATDLAGYIAPASAAAGALEGISYASDGGSTPNVGWVLFRDGGEKLRGVWLAGGGPWQTATLSNVKMLGAPSAAFDPATRKLNVAYVDSNAHLRLLTEGSTWSNYDFHASSNISMPLSHLGTERKASDTITFHDGSKLLVTAAAYGIALNDVTVDIAAGASLSAVYDSIAQTLIVTVPSSGVTTASAIAATIDALTDFEAKASSPFGGFNPFFDVFATLGVLEGGTEVRPGNAVRPDLYVRPHSVSGAPAGMHILYKDQANHVHNVRAIASQPVFDTTAFLEGYRPTYGYGIVNAATAVAYALGSSAPLNGAGSGAWNLSLIRAPSVWNTATGQNVAVFALDSGIDTSNSDMLLLTGFNVAANSANTTDTNGHGTGVAGIIAGVNDGAGVTGVAYNARVVPVKLGDLSVLSESTIVAGIDYATKYDLPAGYVDKTRIVNMSFASTAASMSSVRDKLYQNLPNTLFVTAAGNRTQRDPDTPAAYNVGFGIVAGAINSASQLWSPTNGTTGALTPYNYLLAPGASVTAATLVGASGNSHNTALVDGTSAAAAHISGVVALMLEANPDLTPREIEAILIASADQVVTQTVSAIAPSISATIYWAGGNQEGEAALASLVAEAASPAEVEEHSITSASSYQPVDGAAIAQTMPARIHDAVISAAFSEDSQGTDGKEEVSDLFDFLAAHNERH